jgi:hypothetical protein
MAMAFSPSAQASSITLAGYYTCKWQTSHKRRLMQQRIFTAFSAKCGKAYTKQRGHRLGS